MNTNNNQFSWRDGAFKMNMGNHNNDSTCAIFSFDDNGMLIVSKESIWQIQLADTTDPNRTNPSIPNTKKRLLNYGAESHFVGRTLLQAKELFDEQALESHLDYKKALRLSFDFLNEITSIYEQKQGYFSDIKNISEKFRGTTDEDDALDIPQIENLEQKLKKYVQSVDHAIKPVMEIVQIFYPSIKNVDGKKWNIELETEWQKLSDKNPADFIKSVNPWIWQVRNIRNAIEHPKPEDCVDIRNFSLTPSGKVTYPAISYANKDTPLQTIAVTDFMEGNFSNLIVFFENLLAYLCNLHARPFAGDKRYVVEIPEDQREFHVRFKYQIAWTS